MKMIGLKKFSASKRIFFTPSLVINLPVRWLGCQESGKVFPRVFNFPLFSMLSARRKHTDVLYCRRFAADGKLHYRGKLLICHNPDHE